MKLLVINGSPRGNNSNTMKLTNAIIKGFEEDGGNESEIIQVKDLSIKNCTGCMSCWGATAGRCVIDDEMRDIHRKIMEADVIINSFPLYFFGMPGPMKNFFDRLMPLMETYKGGIKDIGDDAFHETRFDISGKKILLVSTCGYGRTEEIYDSLIKQFNFIFGKGRYIPLLCPQSEMFAIEQLKPQREAYLERYVEIGRGLAKGEVISEDMIKMASEPILPQRAFEILVNNYWNSVSETK